MERVRELLEHVLELHEAVRSRNELRVHALLRAPEAAWIPRIVRDEAIGMARLPAGSLRAPVQLFMFLHRLEALAPDVALAADDAADAAARAGDPDQLALPLTAVGE